MMKIHTTQNLNSLATSQPTNISMPKQIRYTKYSDASNSSHANSMDFYESMSFKGKKPDAKDAKKALEALKKPVEAVKKKFGERVADKCSNLLGSDSFGKVLSWTEAQEVLVQSGSALIVCSILRPGTLALFPGDKNKQDFLYAAAHSISSGWWGFGVSTLFVKPPASGVNHVLDNMGKYIKDEMLEKMYPQLEMKSIYNVDSVGNKVRKPVAEWLDKAGRQFKADTKNVRKIFKPLHISEISEETLVEKLKDLNVSSLKGADGIRVSANAWKDKAGNEVKFALEDMFICVKDEAAKTQQYYPLEFVNPEILQKIFPNLDEKSIINKAGERLHPDMWKTLDGKAFKLDKDMVFISSARDCAKTIPLTAGYTRKDIKGNLKDICYQDNARVEGRDLGTEITTEMLEAAEVNKIVQKLGGWLPDIVVTYPRAAATIAVLPFILKHGFGLEKTKKTQPQPEGETSKTETEPTGKEVK